MIVAGTGHRPDKLGGYNSEADIKLYELAWAWLRKAKPSKVISGMALGWDMALAHAAIDLNITLIAAIPFKGQELKWSAEMQNKYNWVLLKAHTVVTVCEGGFSAEAMQLRNEYMVDNADIILTVFDGTKGGTRNCLI